MESFSINPFLTLFCKELSNHLETVSARQKSISPNEFAEVVSSATQEVLESYLNGEFDLQQYFRSHEDEYLAIAKASIDSYASSNHAIGKISDQQSDLLDCENISSGLIDFNTIAEKFCDMQHHLSAEISKANATIHDLSTKVRDLELRTTLDPLTKTFNRSALQQHLTKLLSHDIPDQSMFLLMIDVDNFKMINDQFGHIAGDKVLIFISKLLKKTLRDGDRVYRFGGEEFVILLNRTDMEGATLVASRLLSLCRQNKPLFQNEQIAVTLSIGMTAILEKDTMDGLIHRADVALYRAKHSGKDKLEVEL